ncbi:MAG TPA: gamma-glutamyltransferase family protein [Polyangiaceae bacterium]|nr:gamma-glutamyltransferase family protein [Polyangiaceae bacterium]
MKWGVRAALLGSCIAGLGLFDLPALARAPGQAVATENPTATRDALAILRGGGSAADAAITAALVAGVTSPSSSGLGGGGFALSYDAATGAVVALDFREVAPRGLNPADFERSPFAAEERGLWVGAPGEARGLYELHRRQGKLPWAQLVRRAEERARAGYLVSQHLANALGWSSKSIAALPGFAAIYYPQGKPAAVGVRLTNPALAATLRRLAAEGPDSIYQGPIAEEIVAAARAHGSSLALADLSDYKVVERTPLRVRYGAREVVTMPPPSAGGILVAQLLRLFPAEQLEPLGFASPAYRHLLAEGMRGALADRMRYLGDPDVQPVDVAALLDEKRLERRRASIALDRTHALPRFGLEESGTHHLVTADRRGNVVSLTTTVNRAFGAKLMTETSGIVLNDELDDFTLPGAVRPFGLSESPNRPRPGARPVSSMTPTLVFEAGQPVLALGGSGGMAIATNVAQVLLGSLVFGQTPEQALRAERFFVPTQNATLLVPGGTPPQQIEDLGRRGEIVGILPEFATAVQVVRFDGDGVRAGADPRKFGEGIAE